MARPKSIAPGYRFHLSGQACCEIEGITFYLGKHGSHESYARYTLLLRVYQDNGLTLPSGFDGKAFKAMVEASEFSGSLAPIDVSSVVTVGVLTESFRQHVCNRYSQPHQAQDRERKLLVLKHLQQVEGLDVAKFGPKLLKRIRSDLVDKGSISRSYTNRIVNEIKRVFRWGVSEELVRPEVVTALETLPPLLHGEGAYETNKREAVKLEHVQATAKHLSPIVRDMLRVQLATGMRPSEVCNMRPADIDRTGEVWIYRPSVHKTAYRGLKREIPLLGEAREAVENYLNRKRDSFLFSPAEAMAWFRAKQSADRLGYGSYKRPKAEPKKTPGQQYTHSSYCKAIQAAAKKAGVPLWTPYQVRHLVGCIVGQQMQLEAAKSLLGHENIRTTEIYSKSSTKQAIEAAKIAPRLEAE